MDGIIPVILSGGSGSRLWPLSRRLRPKQFLSLYTDNSLFRDTLDRVTGPQFGPPLAICNDDHRFMVAEIFREAGCEGDIILEPMARNTAPAIAAAALSIAERDADALMLVLPSDHVITDPDGFLAALTIAAQAARAGNLVTFGMTPHKPETGYGYIRRGAALDGVDGAFAVDRFVEKPDLATAKDYLRSGDYQWNSGIFLFAAKALIEEMETRCPDIIAACRDAVGKGQRDLTFLRLDADAFAGATSISIDHGVMEKTDRAVVIPASFGWSDIGSWSALWDISETDEANNVVLGDAIIDDVSDCYIRSEKPLIAAIGVTDLVIVATDDTVFIAPKDRAQEARTIVTRLAAEGRHEHESHSRVFRPWGHYQNLEQGPGFLVKRIMVKAGEKLSLQYHNHRAEHWVVVSGTATVTNGDDILTLAENQSTYIPLGAKHRLENRTRDELHLVEVQSGDHISEQDIVRLEDTYGRHG
ncbi:MAG TPA: mannose-1-phosphate guanylyltransferase/mannose-6-phosphate isomerase [Rhodospirillales bacterium]|nr:mannose-1-phosphate guanylyltransferase/mannose-6-phosphate isomerase [Rhodospirillales bacterium]